MIESLVMTIIGADRAGIVELVSARVADHGGNWLESRMCHLGGRFAGIARVEVPQEKLADLKRALHGLEADGLRVVVEAGGYLDKAAGVSARLALVGHDRPGILRAVTGILASHGVNVEELSSECVSAPMDGGTLFQAQVRMLVPPAVKLETLRHDLEKIATDLMVDIKLESGK